MSGPASGNESISGTQGRQVLQRHRASSMRSSPDKCLVQDTFLWPAANRVILTTERVVSNEQIRRAPDHTKIPFFAVDAVVELPFGCAPHECYGAYEPMLRHMEYYVGLVNSDPVGGMREYLDRFVYGPGSWTKFLELIGVSELLEAARAGRSLYDA